MNGDLEKAVRGMSEDLEKLVKTQGEMTDEFTNHFNASSKILTSYANSVAESTKMVRQNTQEYGKMQKAQERLEARQEKYKEGIEETRKEIEALIKNKGNLSEKEREKEIKHLNHKLAMQIAHAKKVADFETGLLKERFDEQESRFKAYQELTKNHQKQMQRLGGFASGMGSKAKSGDLSGVASGGLEGMGTLLKQLGGVGGKLGMVATALGATVGVLGVFVALMFEADKKAKDMSKNIMQGASGLDLMSGKFEEGKITEKLGQMRDMAFDVGMQFRMSADEVTNVMSAFNQASLRYDEMTKLTGKAGVSGLGDALDVAITKSKMLGVEANTVAQTIAQMNENFAMDLSQIDEAFSAIYMSAQTTGIATQKFFAMITQVTGGMSLLNVDFAQTAAIAGELVESLGEAAGSKFLGELANRGASKSYQDRLKSSLLSGGKTSRIGKKGVRSRAAQLESSVGFQSVMGDTNMNRMFNSLGLSDKITKREDGSVDLMTSLSAMSHKDRQNFMASIGNTQMGGSAEIERQVRELSELNIASKRGDSTVAMGKFNLGENMAQSLAEMGAFADLSKGQSLGGMDRMVLEQIAGKSGMEIDQMVTMIDKMNSNMGFVQSYADQIKGGKSLDAIAQEQGMNTAEFQQMLQEQYKLTVGEDGKVKSSITGKEITNLEDYMINMGDSMKDSIEKAMSEEDAMTSEIVKNTASMSAILENMIGKVLNDIYISVDGLWNKIVGDSMRDKNNERTIQMMESLKGEMADLYDQNEKDMAKASELRQKVKTGSASASERTELQMLEGTIASNKAQIQEKMAARVELQKTRSLEASKGKLGDLRASNVTAQALSDAEMEALAEDVLREFSSSFQIAASDAIERSGRVTEGTTLKEKDFYDFSKYEDSPMVQKMFDSMGSERGKEALRKVMREKGASTTYEREGKHYKMPELEQSILSGLGVDVAWDVTSPNAGQMNQNMLGQGQLGKALGRRRRKAESVGDALGSMSKEETQALKDSGLLVETADGQLAVQQETYDQIATLVPTFATNAKDTKEMKEFEKKNLAPAIGSEVQKAMVAMKLIEVAGAAGMSLNEVLDAQKSQTDNIIGNDVHVASRIDAKIAALDPSKDQAKIAELEKQKQTLTTLGIKDATLINGKMIPQQKGSIITTPDGTSYHTDPADNMLIGTKVGMPNSGGGGGGIHIGTVVVKADDPATFERKLRAVAKTKSGRNAMSGRSR